MVNLSKVVNLSGLCGYYAKIQDKILVRHYIEGAKDITNVYCCLVIRREESEKQTDLDWTWY